MKQHWPPIVKVLVAWKVWGLLHMTDPSTGPHPEGSPAYTGSVKVPDKEPGAGP